MAGSVFAYDGATSYQSFLSDKSAVGGLNLLVNAHAASSLATQNDLTRRGLETMDQMAGNMSAGMQQIGTSLDRVRAEISSLGNIVEHGFYAISRDLNGINENLQELIEIAKTPDQTWAFEQYNIAGDAYERGHISDALDYVNRAIKGHGDRSGFRLEHRFHILRGLIHLGGPGNGDPQIVDPAVAAVDFETAIKYASHTDNDERSQYHNLAGWAHYCSGNMDEAETHLARAVELDHHNSRAQYDYAKLLTHRGKVPEGMEHLGNALKADWLYGIRAASDPDFLTHEQALKDEFAFYRALQEQRAKLAAIMFNGDLKYRERQKIAAEYDVTIDDQPAEFFETLESKLPESTVAGLIALNNEASGMREQAEQNIDSARADLNTKLDDTRKPTKVIDPDIVLALVVWPALLIGFLLGFINWGMIAAIILTIVFGIISFIAAPTVIVPVVWMIQGLVSKSRAADRRIKLEKGLMKFEKA